MPCEFRFLITSPDPALLPQVARALRAYTDQDFRARYPRLWAVYDRLIRYSKEKSPREDRKILRFFRLPAGLVNWPVGPFLLLPTTLALGEFFFLFLVGAIAFLAGNLGPVGIGPATAGDPEPGRRALCACLGRWLPPQAEGEEPRQLPFGQIRCLCARRNCI